MCASAGNNVWLCEASVVRLNLLFHTAQRPRGKTMMVPCDTEYPAFVSERTIKETTGNIDCDGCLR